MLLSWEGGFAHRIFQGGLKATIKDEDTQGNGKACLLLQGVLLLRCPKLHGAGFHSEWDTSRTLQENDHLQAC